MCIRALEKVEILTSATFEYVSIGVSWKKYDIDNYDHRLYKIFQIQEINLDTA